MPPRRQPAERDRKRAAGKRLAVARVKLGLTQQQLAAAIGASLQTIKSYEGGRRTPSGEYAVALTRVGINPMYVFEGGDHAAFLPAESGARETVADLVKSAVSDDALSTRLVRRSDHSFRAAKAAVAVAARRYDFQMPEFVRASLVIAMLEGMTQSALGVVMQMLRDQRILESREGELLFVKPAPGLKVRDPLTRAHLPAGGAEVPKSSYWLRRLRDGAVIEATRPKITSKI